MGEPVEVPVYLFHEHTRAADTYKLASAEVVIVEGILTLHHERIRVHAAVKAFVETDEQECLRRRVERDIAERGRTRESVLSQYAATVRPMTIEYVLPSRRYADIIVSGEESLEWAAGEILRVLSRAGV
jgi:uridine kinase